MGSTFSTRIPGQYPLDHPRGWIVVLGSVIIQCGVFGLVQCFPVFHHLMTKDPSLGYPTKAQLSLVNAICTSVGIWVGWIWGYFGSQFGPKPLFFVATLLMAVGTLLPPIFAHSYLGLIFLYAIPCSMANGITNAPMTAAVGSWFDRYLSTAIGVLNVGGGAGTLIGPIVAGFIANATGDWRISFYALSSFSLLGVAGLLLVKPRMPVKETRPALDPAILESKGRAVAMFVQIGRDLKVAAKICFTKNFGLLFVSGVAVGYNFFGILYVVIIIALDFGEEGTPYSHLAQVPLSAASSVFLAFGLTAAPGSVAWGLIGLKLPTKHALALSLSLSALASLVLAQATSLTGLLVGMAFAGFGAAGGWVLFPTLIVEYFPCGSLLGLVMGLGYTSIGIGATLGPFVTTLVTVSPSLGAGSYTLGLAVSALICVIGAMVCGFGLPMQHYAVDVDGERKSDASGGLGGLLGEGGDLDSSENPHARLSSRRSLKSSRTLTSGRSMTPPPG